MHSLLAIFKLMNEAKPSSHEAHDLLRKRSTEGVNKVSESNDLLWLCRE